MEQTGIGPKRSASYDRKEAALAHLELIETLKAVRASKLSLAALMHDKALT